MNCHKMVRWRKLYGIPRAKICIDFKLHIICQSYTKRAYFSLMRTGYATIISFWPRLPLLLLLMLANCWQQTIQDAQESPELPTTSARRHLDQIQALTAPPADSGDATSVSTITVGGGKISLDALGPAIVAEDGTLRRIANWGTLSEREQQVALRRIGQRNQVRIAALQQQQAGEKPEEQQQLKESDPEPLRQKPDAAERGDPPEGSNVAGKDEL